jgi:hypothetical protein
MSDTHENTRNDESLRQRLTDKLVGRDRNEDRDAHRDDTHSDDTYGDGPRQGDAGYDDGTDRGTATSGEQGGRSREGWVEPARDDDRLAANRPGAEERLGADSRDAGAGPAGPHGGDLGDRTPGAHDRDVRDGGVHDPAMHDGGAQGGGVQARDVTSGSIGDAGRGGPDHRDAGGLAGPGATTAGATTAGAAGAAAVSDRRDATDRTGPTGPDRHAAGARQDAASDDGVSQHATSHGGTRHEGAHEGDPALIPQDRSADYMRRWESLKAGFVDEPRAAVRDANQLVGQVLDELEELFRNQRGELERDLGNDQASTEDLRLALGRYRSFFDRLLKI